MLTRKTFEGRIDECRNMLKDYNEWNKLPMLNLATNSLLCDGQLARFQGMIQYMDDPQIYMAEYEVLNVNTGVKEIRKADFFDDIKIGDDEELLLESKKTVSMDRKIYYCISVPGLNDWVEEYNLDQQRVALEQLEQQMANKTLEKSTKKRCFCDESNGEGSMGTSQCTSSACKRLCTSQRDTSTLDPPDSRLANYQSRFPIKTTNLFGCVIHVYNGCEFKLNEIVEVAGFLSIDPAADLYTDSDCFLPPPSPIRNIHINVVCPKKITNCNPLITLPSFNSDELMKNVENIRAELSTILTKLFFDDCLAADYFMCYLLSSIFNRESDLVLGKFCLNISNVPRDCDYAQHLYKFLSHLVPKSHYLPITIETLNTMTLLPKKTYDKCYLESGMLQLSNNTFIMLDETQLQPGDLVRKGIDNVNILSNTITSQKVAYDFVYYPLDFNCDFPFLIISEGKSMFPSDFHVVLKNTVNVSSDFVKELFNEAIQYMKNSDILNTIRKYLSVMSSLVYELNKDIEAQIAEDFVKMRKNIGNVTAQDLHQLLILARLFSMTRGCTTLTMNTWEIVQEMERQRKAHAN